MGETDDDPASATGPVSNLLSVFGDRLDSYNAGNVVPLYDAYGTNDAAVPGGGYPPVCGVRYDAATNGPISEWMFCTDYTSLVCSGVNAQGQLVDKDGNVLPWKTNVPGNPKLDPETEKMIVALINGSWSYSGTGYFDFPDTSVAQTDGSSNQRVALQELVWCLTDPPSSSATGTEAERYATCEDSMSDERQAEILASVPDAPEFSVALEGSGSGLVVGDTATFIVETNILNRGIEITVTGPANALTVVSGPATLIGSTLTVTGTGPVRLSVVGTGAGSVELRGATETVASEHLAWHQSQRTDSGEQCQVFATMFGTPVQISESDTVAFADEALDPVIGTSLVDSADGDRVLPWNGGTVVDTVAYQNLEVGTEYTLTGELMDKADGSATGITGSVTFTPTAANGSIDVSFVVPEGYAGRTLVAFEQLHEGTDTTGDPVAVHEDIDDPAQTVTVEEAPPAPEKPKGEKLPETGGTLPWIGVGAASLLLVAGAALLATRRKKVDL